MPIDNWSVVEVFIPEQAKPMAANVVGLANDCLNRHVRAQQRRTMNGILGILPKEKSAGNDALPNALCSRFEPNSVKGKIEPFGGRLADPRAQFFPTHVGQAGPPRLPF